MGDAPPAGWYLDPGGTGKQRYWTGTAWHPVVKHTTSRGAKIGLSVGAVAVVGLVIFGLSTGHDTEAVTVSDGATTYPGTHAPSRSSTSLDPIPRISPIPMPVPTAPPGGVTAQQVVDAVRAEGLPAGKPRDNTSNMCGDVGCTQLMTTDDFSVYQFPDKGSAQRWADGFPGTGYLNGFIFIRYTEGGSYPTNPLLKPQYNSIVDRLVAAGG